jgi:hypothetical protein
MRKRLRATATLIFVTFLLGACGRNAAWPGSLEALLESQPERFATVSRAPTRHRVQIIYTQIDRDERNRPSFRSYHYRVDPREYFYPASTVKLPVALLALEKINRLGLSRDLTMLTGAATDIQTAVERDETAPGGLPSVGHYIRKIFLVSDNDAYNRLYEFIGQQELNESLHRKGYAGTRIIHRLEIALDPLQNQQTNPVRFVDGDVTLYEQDAVHSAASFQALRPQLLGKAEIVDGEYHERPKDFAVKNAFPLQDMHDMLLGLMFPDTVDDENRFRLTGDDYRFLYRTMAAYPSNSGIDAYGDPEVYPDGYVKFLMYGGSARSIPDRITVFNKVGDAYGFLTDCAYVVDFENKVEFILAATVYTNENQTFNDGNYEYDEIGLPFLRDLGQAIYEIELARDRPHEPDLSRFRFDGAGPVD